MVASCSPNFLNCRGNTQKYFRGKFCHNYLPLVIRAVCCLLRVSRLPALETSDLPFVSILVPAFNEAETIEATLNSVNILRQSRGL
jgi:cellulose synthase/poly-beta-1,6-N-acetylglucosamine synthase-like glycosyltransferase